MSVAYSDHDRLVIARQMVGQLTANNRDLNENLTATQARCNELLEENRAIRATAAAMSCPSCDKLHVENARLRTRVSDLLFSFDGERLLEENSQLRSEIGGLREQLDLAHQENQQLVSNVNVLFKRLTSRVNALFEGYGFDGEGPEPEVVRDNLQIEREAGKLAATIKVDIQARLDLALEENRRLLEDNNKLRSENAHFQTRLDSALAENTRLRAEHLRTIEQLHREGVARGEWGPSALDISSSTQALADHDHGGQTAAGDFGVESLPAGRVEVVEGGDFGIDDSLDVAQAEIADLRSKVALLIGENSEMRKTLRKAEAKSQPEIDHVRKVAREEIRQLREKCVELDAALDKARSELDEINAHHEWLASGPDGKP